MKTRIIQFHLLLAFILMGFTLKAQTADTLIMNNGNLLVGQIKEMNHGVLQFKTKYSDSDFNIKWDNIKTIRSKNYFIVYLEKGIRYYGTINTTDPNTIRIFDMQKGSESVNKKQVLYIKEAEQSFLSRLSFDVSLGYSLAKANKSHQLITNLNSGYLANTYSLTLNYSMNRNIQTVQDTIETKTKRTELNVGGKYFLPNNWFASATGNFLNSTELKLKLRSAIQLGGGLFLINNHVHNLSVEAGGVWNIENYYESTGKGKNSFEAYVGIDYNIISLGDLDLNTNLNVFPGITEKGRFRSDFAFNVKYEFISDFFISLGFNYNYDNQPVAGATRFDYNFNTTIGWEL